MRSIVISIKPEWVCKILNKDKAQKDKPLVKVTYYTDENGQIKRKKISIE